MRLAIVTRPELPHQREHCGAMAAGIERHGHRVDRHVPGDKIEADAVVCWGWLLGKHYRELGFDVLVMERGYVGDRRAWTAVGWNGLNGHAQFPPAPDGARWGKYFGGAMKPWREAHDGYFLVAGQVPGDQSLAGIDIGAWVKHTKTALKLMDLPVKVRPHPLAGKPDRSLAEDLAGARLVVTYNSNVGVDAVLAGVPAVAMNRGSMAWAVTGHDLSDVVMPERTEWAHNLAFCQWTRDEIASGHAWEAVSTCRSL